MHAQGVWEYIADGLHPFGLVVDGRQVFIINGNSCTRAVNTLIRRGLLVTTVIEGCEVVVKLSDAGQIEMKRFKGMRALAQKQRADHEKAMRR